MKEKVLDSVALFIVRASIALAAIGFISMCVAALGWQVVAGVSAFGVVAWAWLRVLDIDEQREPTHDRDNSYGGWQ